MSNDSCNVVVRLALESDVPAVMDIVTSVIPAMTAVGNHQWSNDYPASCHFLEDVKLQQLWVATLDGVVVGAGALTTDQPPEYAEAGWDLSEKCIVPHRLAVSPSYQGKGIAAAIMKKGIAVYYFQHLNITTRRRYSKRTRLLVYSC